jgi:predicted metal-dependent hydrolase
MKAFPIQTELGEIPVKWCNADAVTSSVMEGVSFVTPVLENFFIRTVVEGMRAHPDDDALVGRCREFLHEESNHSLIHKKFNQQLLHRLNTQPPGLMMVSKLLDLAKNHLSLASRLALAAALEHFTAVISKVYLSHESDLQFQSVYAKELFDWHAKEELDHRSVVFDLWQAHGTSGPISRFTAVLIIFGIGGIYLALSVPWILHKKSDKSIAKTLSIIYNFAKKNARDAFRYTPMAELFSFARKDFHPEFLVKDTHAPVTHHN